MAKYKLTWKDLSWSDFKTYLFALFKAFIPKKKLSNLTKKQSGNKKIVTKKNNTSFPIAIAYLVT